MREVQNLITVYLQRAGERELVLELPEDSTVEEALNEAQLPLDVLPTVGGQKATLNALLDDGDVLVFQSKGIKQGA